MPKISSLALVALIYSNMSVAGQPLVTDDAGVLDKGGWEFQLWVEQDKRDAGEALLAPAGEVAYGFTDRLQGAVSMARIEIDAPGLDSRSDLDALGLELKALLYAGEQWSLAFAPGYAFPLKSSSTDREIIEDVRVASLPLIATWEQGKWAVDANIAVEIPSSGNRVTFAGVAAGYQVLNNLKLLAEVYRFEVSGSGGDETNFNVGFDYAVNDNLAFLFSVGSGLNSNLDRLEELDRATFLGFRYETG